MQVKVVDSSLLRRLEESRVLEKRVEASLVIFSRVMKWYAAIRTKRSIANALQSVMRRDEELKLLFLGEENMSIGLSDDGGSIVSFAESM
ncbi:hypothetical protein EON64_11930 [archaeon]|nr:MAG: hypothetical protein EON64_11930 [archaeon]